MMTKLTLQRYNADAVRVMRGTEVVGMILRLGNERWTLNDRREQPLTKRTFGRPGEALAYAKDQGYFLSGDTRKRGAPAQPRGTCSACGKKGLGNTYVAGGGRGAYRQCRYCNEITWLQPGHRPTSTKGE
jgi:hypothetical protein